MSATEKKVGIIDYGAGNIGSVVNAFKKHNCEIYRITQPQQLSDVTHIVLPGVGAFSAAVDKLKVLNLFSPLKEILQNQVTPFLGICVGMQILASAGDEFEYSEGFNAINGVVKKFTFAENEKPLILPHIGWNDIIYPENTRLFKNIDKNDSNFYFVHSYHLISDEADVKFSYSEYGSTRFISAIEKGIIFGVQFHPEKSQYNGDQLIQNFLMVSNA